MVKVLEKIPNIIHYWSDVNNVELGELEYFPTEVFFYNCLKCRKNSKRKFKDFYNRPEACGVCSGKIVIVGFNDALTANPEIINHWDYILNEKTPQDFTKQSSSRAWSNCKKCKHSTLRRIYDMVNLPEACSVCSGKIVVGGFNDLKTLFPKLALEWNYEKNSKIPEETYPFGRGKIWWKCLKYGHEWECTISSRTSMGNNCPYCGGQKVLPGYNDLATVLPEVLKYWNYEKNILSPTEVTVNSNKVVHWRCPKGHEWRGAVSGRSKTHTNDEGIVKYFVFDCNRCSRSKRSSKKEKELLEFCKTLNVKVEGSYILIKGVEYDIYFPELKLAIDFNGDYWHSEKLMKTKYGVSALEWHGERKSRSFNAGVSLFYVWESDWGNNEEEVKKAIIDLINNGSIGEILKKNYSELF